MKTNSSYQKPLQKPIKYQQFIQQLQNLSRSSNIDQSLLSQRSFRQSTTARDHNEKFKHQTCQYLCQKQSSQKLNCDSSSYKIPHRLHVDKDQNKDKPISQIQDKLYTFCDAKITQTSIEMVHNTSISINNRFEQHQQKPITHNNNNSSRKYFKTHKQRNQQKENIDFANQILSKVESGQFQKKLTKVQNCCQLYQHLSQKDQAESPQRIQLIKTSINQKDLLSSQPNNSQRKIQSVKKIFVLSRQSSNRNSSKKKLVHNNSVNEQKSKQSSLHKNEQTKQRQQQHQKQHQQQQSNQKCSSKKKIISLNINPLKTNLSNQLFNNNHNINNPTKVKLSLNKSYDKTMQQSTNIQNSSLSHSLSKMPQLNQSKILYQSNTCINYNQLNNNTTSHHHQQQQQQVQKLTKLLNQYKEKQKKSTKQINQLNKKLKLTTNESQKKQLQILQKDCMRLTNSYKQIKKLYQTITKSKQHLQNHLQNVLKQNNDLKQCLNFKSSQVVSLNNQLSSMHTKIQHLQHSLQQTHTFPQQLSGLSQIIKQNITQYQSQIWPIREHKDVSVFMVFYSLFWQ